MRPLNTQVLDSVLPPSTCIYCHHSDFEASCGEGHCPRAQNLLIDSEIQYQPIVRYEKQKKCIGSRGRGPRRTRLVFSLAVCDGSPCLRRSRLLASHFCLQLQDYGSLSPDTLPTSSRHFLRLDLASIRPV